MKKSGGRLFNQGRTKSISRPPRRIEPRQNEWQGDGNETAADAVGQNKKKENEWMGGFAIAHWEIVATDLHR